jgi:hypothetical protein
MRVEFATPRRRGQRRTADNRPQTFKSSLDGSVLTGMIVEDKGWQRILGNIAA